MSRSTVLLVASILGALLSLSSVHKVHAQSPSALTGQVTVSGVPAEAVTVSIEGTSLGVVSDALGAFRLSGLPAGRHVLVARRMGLEVLRREIVVTEGQDVRLTLDMRESVMTLGDIVVTASREKERRVEIPMSIGVIGGDEIRDVRPAHPSEIMNRVSGVWVNVTGGEGHMTSIRQPLTTDPVYLYLEDGVPSRSTGFFNHNALYEINLPQADRIEVSKGPANALYGSDAIGGVVNVSSRAASLQPEASLIAEGGRFGFGRVLASMSDTWGRNGLRLDGNFTRTDGWRSSTDYTREAGSLRWDRRSDGGLRMRTLATFSIIDQQTAGSSAISRTDYRDDPTRNYTPFSLRAVKAFRLSSALEHEQGRALWSVTPYARYDEMRLIPNWSLTFDPQDYTTANWSAGLLSKVRRDFAPMRTRVIVGADLDWSPGWQKEWQLTNLVRQGPVFVSYTRGQQLYDYDVTYWGASPYTQVEVSPVQRLRVSGGLRYDMSGYDYDNRMSTVTTGRWRRPEDMRVSYSHLSPKLGATYEFAPELAVFAGYRHGFRAPSQGQLFRQGSSINTVALQPVKAENVEGGVRGTLANRLNYDVTAYSLVKHDDILSFTRTDGSTEVQNAGTTTHRGVELGLGFAVSRPLRVDLNWSQARHMLGTWRPNATTNLSGRELPNAPRGIGGATVRYASTSLPGATTEVQWAHVGSYWQDQANTHRYPGHDLFHLRVNAPVGPRVTASVRVMNLTDQRYAETSQFTTARGEEYAPGLPRTWYGALQYDFR
jgi:outer membrane receptor protein involved in Fe transport